MPLRPRGILRKGLWSSVSLFGKRQGIHAVAESGWSRSIGKHMPEMGVAGIAPRFHADHSE